MNGDFLFQAVIYLTAAVVCVPLAKKLGLSSVLGYLFAGILIGPFILGFVGEEGEDIMHFAEVGVVMMLFLIGLELEPMRFWRMRRLVVGMGTMQVVATVVLFSVAGVILGLPWNVALTIGMAIALSSTAIVLQTMKEKGLMASASGQSSFAVLLFQDIAVIPMLAILPLLALSQNTSTSTHGNTTLLEPFPAWFQAVAVFLAVGFIIVAGKYLIVPLLRIISKTHLRELFTACALLIVLSITYLMQVVGLSPALGAFLGGVVLANSEFRHELESDLEPFKGLLLGLFFIAVGASVNFLIISQNPMQILLILISVLILKSLILFLIGRFYKLSIDQNLQFSLGLAQIGEFSFVLVSLATQLQILDTTLAGIMMAVTALTMAASPIVSMINERMILPMIGTRESIGKEMDTIDQHHAVILVGFAHFGSTLGRFLRANGVDATILDHDSDRVDLLRKMGFKVFYGDATRMDLLESAGAAGAKILISAIDSPETNLILAERVKKHFPHLQLMIRARNRSDTYDLMELGVQHIYRESLETSVKMAVDALIKLGHRAYSLTRSAQNFIKYDEESLKRLALERKNKEQYIIHARNEIQQQEILLRQNLQNSLASEDHAWDSEYMRNTLQKQTHDQK